MHATRITTGASTTAAWATAGALAALASLAQAADEAQDALYQRFEIAAAGAWGDVALDLVPGTWRVGHPDGPLADASQVALALAHLGVLRVRGRCAGSAVAAAAGSTEYPCGFALARLEIDGIAAPRLQGIAGADTPTISIRGPEQERSVTAKSELDARERAGEHPVDVVVGIAEGFGARPGGRIRFAYRAVPNAMAPSRFDPASGLVVLEPGRRKADSKARGEQEV